MTEERGLVATASQTVGPFFHVGPGATDRFGRMAGPEAPGERIRLRLRVLDGDGAPVPDALVELWQADANGLYSSPPSSAPGSPAPAFSGFGRLGTDDTGLCTFETIRPGRVRDPSDGAQASHVNVCIFARGLMRHLYTRVYFEDDPALSADPLLALVPADRRATLFAHACASAPEDSLDAACPAHWEFVVRLQGEGETVFFDL